MSGCAKVNKFLKQHLGYCHTLAVVFFILEKIDIHLKSFEDKSNNKQCFNRIRNWLNDMKPTT